MPAVDYPLFKAEDVDGFFALFQNNLANFAVISITMIELGYPAGIVFGRVIPGAAIAVLFGNLYYSRMARQLAEKEGREDVTALSYGISTPVMFIYLLELWARPWNLPMEMPSWPGKLGWEPAFWEVCSKLWAAFLVPG